MFYLVCVFQWHVITAKPLEPSRGEDGQSVLSLGWLPLTAQGSDYVTSRATNSEDNCQFCVIKSKKTKQNKMLRHSEKRNNEMK